MGVFFSCGGTSLTTGGGSEVANLCTSTSPSWLESRWYKFSTWIGGTLTMGVSHIITTGISTTLANSTASHRSWWCLTHLFLFRFWVFASERWCEELPTLKTVGTWSNPKNKTIFPFRSGITAAVIIIRTRILGTTKTTINKIVRTTIGATIGTKTYTTIRSILDNMKLGSGNYNILLFREGKSTSNHKSNCRVDLVPLRTISTGMGVRVDVLVVILKRSKLAPKQKTWL